MNITARQNNKKTYSYPKADGINIGTDQLVCTSPGTEKLSEEGGINGFDW